MDTSQIGGELMKYFSQANIQSRIWHLQTKSFAEHKALDEFYNKIGEFQDELIEVYQGYYSTRISGDMNFKLDSEWSKGKATSFLILFKTYIKDVYKENFLQPTCLQNILDEVTALVDKTLYLLTLE